ncbi:amidase family protein [Nocardia jejuensis]|uniref:amidase family protein n=1 Tax=Nocardia jejuensis TaxID=328049 RepID=UPI000A008071|nr:amidase family protein [Nocardia jejuensis]
MNVRCACGTADIGESAAVHHGSDSACDTAHSAAIDDTVWRAVGTPLVAATRPGVLTGCTVAVKDLYAVAGFAIGAGVRDYPAQPQIAHSAVVAALLDNGADITGITQTDEFAYSITGSNGRYGMPVNPAAPERVPGGSSSGSAVAVAAGQVHVGLGTDTAGSIRVPGAYQGLWGIRATRGRLGPQGLLPLAQSFDAVGWLTRDPHTLASVAECLMPQPEPTARAQLVVDPALCALAHPALAQAALSAARRLNAAPIDLAADIEHWSQAFRAVQAREAWANHGAWITAHPGALEPEVAQRFSYASTITAAETQAARAVLAVASAQLRAALTERILVLPTTATLPPPRDTPAAALETGRARTLQLTCPASIAGLPAITVPVRRIDGIPVGLCFLGAPGTDRSLIDRAGEASEILTSQAL